jgi:hypothetical protein
MKGDCQEQVPEGSCTIHSFKLYEKLCRVTLFRPVHHALTVFGMRDAIPSGVGTTKTQPEVAGYSLAAGVLTIFLLRPVVSSSAVWYQNLMHSTLMGVLRPLHD